MSYLRGTTPFLAITGVAMLSLGLATRLPALEDQEKGPDPQVLARANDLSSAFEYAADQVQHSIVSIKSVVKINPAMNRRANPFQNTPFEDFFGRQFQLDMNPMPQQGLGSGFVWDHNGHIVTNNHVVKGATELEVTLPDERVVSAKVVATDDKTDLAVIKVDVDGLEPVKLGDSDELRIGQWVIAAGNPFGLSSTITAGIVSAKGRNKMGLADYEDFIQTDAAINPGNSGGPLVDLLGRVVGINSAIYTRTGGSMGIGFAIPVNMAKGIIQSLIDDGSVQRGWLGVMIKDMEDSLKHSYDFQGNGILVEDVTPKSPAAEAGIQSEDIITKIDGQPVTTRDALRTHIAGLRPGTNVEVELFRDGDKHVVTVELAKLPADLTITNARRYGDQEDQTTPSSKLGVVVKDLNERIAEQEGIAGASEGALVTSVDAGSPAAMAGIQPGDVIVRVGRENVTSAKQFKSLMSNADLSKGVRLVVVSEGSRRVVLIQSN